MTGNGIPGPAGPAGGPPQNPAAGAMNWQKATPPQAPQQQPQQPPPPPHQQMPPQPPPHQQQQGYGYPQQAAAPPQGYGAVPPGPQRYGGGQQTPPAAHAPYPGQAPYGAPAPAAAPPKKGKAGLIVLLVVALVVLGGAGAGAWFLLQPSADDNVLWSQPGYKGKMPPGERPKQVDGTWTTDKAVIQTLPDGVKAYDPDTGKRLWATRIPGDTNTTCSAPRPSDGDIGIVAYGDNKACNHLVAYDLKTGKQLWTKELKNKPKPKPKPGDRFTPADTNPLGKKENAVVRSGDVVVTWGSAGPLTFKASDGSPAWTPETPRNCDSGSYTGGKALIRIHACRTKPMPGFLLGKPYDEVSLIDPATGKAKWTHTFKPENDDALDGGMVTGKVISTDPIVLLPSREDMGLIALDSETGKIRSRFSPETPAKYVQTWGPEGGSWREGGAFGNTFVLAVADGDEKRLLAAYDLDSGKLLWKTKPEEYTEYCPLPGADGDKILVYKSMNGDKGTQLVEYNAKTGAPHTRVEYPARVADGINLFASPTVLKNKLFLTAVADRTFNPKEAYGIVALTMSPAK